MPAKLLSSSYGKSRVRLTKVTRLPDRHELTELTVDITLKGDFDRSYTHGDNTGVVATDSMKNTVYVLAKDHPVDSPESFARCLANHFVITYSQVRSAAVKIQQHRWHRLDVSGTPHPTAFESGGNERRTASVTVVRNPAGNLIEQHLNAGLEDLLVLKTTDSAFTGFVRDEYTTLPETTDRILATSVSADWTFAGETPVDFNASFARIRAALLSAFAEHKSLAVQQTLYAMGEAALAVEPAIHYIHLHMPNKHRIPFNLKPFNKEFAHDIFITTDEPSGEISAYLSRE